MQKFTIFSLLLSISIILLIGDIITHDYLKADTYESAVSGETTMEIEEVDNSPGTLLEDPAPNPEVELSEILLLAPEFGAEQFAAAGYSEPVLKEGLFSGNIFQLIEFSDQTEAFVYQSNFFEGERYVGVVYEIKYPTETATFQGYLALRERAMALNSMGDVNEVNNYGDTSFYFNHKVKTKTVHLVVKKGSSLYAFEYPYSDHGRIKSVFEQLP